MGVVIAIDGVSGSGKGALAERLARHYRCEYLPTGNIYRLVAKACLDNGVNAPQDKESLLQIAFELSEVNLYSQDLKGEVISNLASVIAKIPELREELDRFQKSWIKKRDFSIVEGRDIGTKICPEAEVKLYLIADLKVRAKRRYEELRVVESGVDEKDIYNDLNARDSRDMGRSCSPLARSDDAHLIDTTNLTIDEMVACAVNIIEKKLTRC